MTPKHAVLVLSFLIIFSVRLPAQWVSQELNLSPGWNAVYLELDPEPNSCDALLEGLPVEGVWMYNTRVSQIQFLRDPAEMVAERSHWMVWRPANHADRDSADLFRLLGARAYLIKVTGTEEIRWVLTGRVAERKHVWDADNKNFVGFCVDEDNPPTFETFFKSSPAHAGQPVYRLNPADGKWAEVIAPSVTKMRRGEGFWISVKGSTDWQGPFTFTSNTGSGLLFGKTMTEIEAGLENMTNSDLNISIRESPSATPPPDRPPIPGDVPLSWFKIDFTEKVNDWIPVEDDGFVCQLKSGQERPLRMMVRRSDVDPIDPDLFPDPVYQSILELSDGNGFIIRVPVTAGLFSSHSALSGGKKRHAGALPSNLPYNIRRGLWVGNVEVSAVAEVNSTIDPLTPKPTDTGFNFLIIVHIDSEDNARLLNEAYIMKTAAMYVQDPTDPQSTILADPGEYVILTEATNLENYEGVRRLGHEVVGSRISTIAYASSQPDVIKSSHFTSPLSSTVFPVLMSADSSTSPILFCTLKLDYNDPLNPFKHKYHPDHDNLTERFDAALPEGKESWDIARLIRLEFTKNDPSAGAPSSEWGDTKIGGTYHETITGIHRYPINVRGKFVLKYTLGVETLGDK